MNLNRRSFIKGCCTAGAGIVAGGHISGLAFGAPGRATDRDILVTVFLRGGMDGLSLVVPFADPDYITNRPVLAIPAPSPNDQYSALDMERGFGLHWNAFFLHQLYQAGTAALVVASGSPDPTRSHFDAQDSMEKGTPGRKDLSTGWIARHLTAVGDTSGIIPVLAASSDVPTSLVGAEEVANITGVDSFSYGGHWSQVDFQYLPLREMYSGDHWLQLSGSDAMDILDRITATNPGNYQPNLPPPVPPQTTNSHDYLQYPGGSWGDSLQTVAQLVKLELGLKVACLDLGGWDTHEDESYGSGRGYIENQVYDLAKGLAAFYSDLANSGYGKKVTIVVMSEFGRRVKENDSRGTDHGHGNNLIVVGGNVNKGVFGQWNGLSQEALDEGKDVPVLNDYRQVLGEILVRRLKTPDLPAVFPRGPAYQPLGVVQGVDPPSVPAVKPGLAVAGVALGLGATLAWRDRRMSATERVVPPSA
jgi:uncharacterized protein (DUF1501 family)